jgi:hypothetical protein
MSTITLGQADGRPPLAEEAERAAIASALFGLALLTPTLIAYAYDDRLLAGASLWAKPQKFQLSLGVHFLTIAWLLQLLPEAVRAGRLLRWSVIAGAVASVLEILYITAQAARGRASHFNLETPLEAAMYNAMGVGAALIVAASFVLGLMIWRLGRDGLGRGLRLGAALGLVLGSLGTLVIGGYLGAQTGHWVGGVASDAGGLPVLGWSTTGGDLRVPHFAATHLMQALPVAGYIADQLVPRSARSAVIAAAAAGLALTALLFVQALRGLPLVAL